MHEPGRDAERELEQLFADPIAQNIAEVLALESQELARTTRAQRGFEAVSRFLARPAYPIALLVFVVGWIGLNLTARSIGLAHLDAPPFPWLNGILTLTALLTTTIVLISQGRQSSIAEQRAHLDLQINLLTEQKVTKLIHLMEELRAEPGVRTRHDPHVSRLKTPADPTRLASALKGRNAASDAADEISPDH
jgi:uncharacterized membrane protein